MTQKTRRLLMATAIIALTTTATAATDPYETTGTLGPYRIGANLTVRNHTTLIAAYYFYAKNPIDIPLTGQITGEQIRLNEPSGGRFTLHFETTDKTARHPLNFYNATALTGTWEGQGHTYPVHLGIDQIDSPQGAERYKNVTSASPQAFEAMVQRFLHDAHTGNKADMANTISFPLRINAATTYILRNRSALYARWHTVFTSCLKAELEKAVPHDMFVHDSMAMVSNGAVWFDAHGAAVFNLNDCPR